MPQQFEDPRHPGCSVAPEAHLKLDEWHRFRAELSASAPLVRETELERNLRAQGIIESGNYTQREPKLVLRHTDRKDRSL